MNQIYGMVSSRISNNFTPVTLMISVRYVQITWEYKH
jgi:hypothetical protein